MGCDSREQWSQGIRVAALALIALFWMTPTARAADEQKPTAHSVLQQMASTLAAAKQLSFHGELSYDESPTRGLLVQIAGAVDVALRRPDGLRMQYRDDLGARTVWYDGKTLTLLDRGTGLVASESTPPTLDATLAQFEESYALTLPLAELLAEDPYKAMLASTLRGTYVGLHDVEGVPCHHLAFLQDDIDWEIWVDRGKVPVPRKLLIRYKREPGAPQYVAVLMDWKLDAKLPDDTFRADVPEQAVAVDFLAIEEEKR